MKAFSEQTRENNEITMINFQSVPKVINRNILCTQGYVYSQMLSNVRIFLSEEMFEILLGNSDSICYHKLPNLSYHPLTFMV